MQTSEVDDELRVATLIETGMLPNRAEAIVDVIRDIEESTEQVQQASKKAALLAVMTQNGIDKWIAFAVLFTHQLQETIHAPTTQP